MTPTKTSKPYRLSKQTLNLLPKTQRGSASEYLWEKSAGVCALCDEPLPIDLKEIEADHRVPRQGGKGGPDTLENLYLACKTCNRIRGNLDFDLGHRIVRFVVWAESKDSIVFDDVLERYVAERGKNVRAQIEGRKATLAAAGGVKISEVFVDPATQTRYFFTEIPVTCVQNDTKSQPREIKPAHVRALAIDFTKHPVHEPSNCRLVAGGGDTASLLQFDGQHKTTAQIILGRESVPMKIYIEPDPVMLQQLVLQIQQGIKKLPLSTSDTLRKLKDVMEDRFKAYQPAEGETRSEKGFIESQPVGDQSRVKKELMLNFQRHVLEDTQLRRYVSKGKSKKKPLTDTVAVGKVIKPLLYTGQLDEDMEVKNARDFERENVVMILDAMVNRLIARGWKKGSAAVDRQRAQNFLYQGSIGWWMNRVLIPAIGTALHLTVAERERLLARQLKSDQKKTVLRLVDALCAWAIWSTDKPSTLKAMRSNTAKDVEAECAGYNDVRLVQDLAR